MTALLDAVDPITLCLLATLAAFGLALFALLMALLFDWVLGHVLNLRGLFRDPRLHEVRRLQSRREVHCNRELSDVVQTLRIRGVL